MALEDIAVTEYQLPNRRPCQMQFPSTQRHDANLYACQIVLSALDYLLANHGVFSSLGILIANAKHSERTKAIRLR